MKYLLLFAILVVDSYSLTTSRRKNWKRWPFPVPLLRPLSFPLLVSRIDFSSNSSIACVSNVFSMSFSGIHPETCKLLQLLLNGFQLKRALQCKSRWKDGKLPFKYYTERNNEIKLLHPTNFLHIFRCCLIANEIAFFFLVG